MVPSGIVSVAELPLTPSGKLDRVRLLAAQAAEATPDGSDGGRERKRGARPAWRPSLSRSGRSYSTIRWAWTTTSSRRAVIRSWRSGSSPACAAT